MARGSVRLRKGRYLARIDAGLDPITGKRRQVSRSFLTEAPAWRWVDQQLALMGNGEALPKDILVVPSGFFVYALYGDSRTTPLYIGQTANLFRRLGEHCTDYKKRHHIRTIGLLRCDSRDHALELERQLIKDLAPPWNTVGRKRP